MAIDDFRGPFRWLSNFEPSEFWYRGKLYLTSEHAYQAAKATTEEDAEHVRSAASPGIARRRGNKILLRKDWDDVKLGIMKGVLREKFKLPELRKKLLETGNHHLVEGNPWGDTFWGVCSGLGENHLGRILMDLRSELRKEEKGNTE